ncbi:MAG: hypothetical protein ACK4K7_02190 [Allosphingosinicella sp.]|uniref:hypothetical protein n=1 Tax=Allosphingosinicella sp. TaxID=2823234 RepID=UPI00394CBC19
MIDFASGPAFIYGTIALVVSVCALLAWHLTKAARGHKRDRRALRRARNTRRRAEADGAAWLAAHKPDE